MILLKSSISPAHSSPAFFLGWLVIERIEIQIVVNSKVQSKCSFYFSWVVIERHVVFSLIYAW